MALLSHLRLSQYADELRDAAFALDEEAVLIAVFKVYHAAQE